MGDSLDNKVSSKAANKTGSSRPDNKANSKASSKVGNKADSKAPSKAANSRASPIRAKATIRAHSHNRLISKLRPLKPGAARRWVDSGKRTGS